MRNWLGFSLLVVLGVVLTACPSPAPASVPLLYYPQNPSLCPGSVKMVNVNPDGYYPPILLKPTTNPPTPPEPGEVLPRDTVIQPFQETFRVPFNAKERYGSEFLCETGNGVVATPGPRLLPRDRYEPGKGIKVLVIVEDSSQAGYLRWYWAYLLR
jgi:hypothetical protein